MADFKKRGGFRGGNSSFGGGNRGGNSGGNSSHGGGHFGGGSGGDRSRFGRPGNKEFRQTQMFAAVCSACQKPCEVPFRPSGDKPVYCSYCFGKNKAGEKGEAPKRDFSPSPSVSAPIVRPAVDGGQMAEMKKQLDIMNSKLDKIVEIISKNSISTEQKNIETIVPTKKVRSKKASTKTVSKKK